MKNYKKVIAVFFICLQTMPTQSSDMNITADTDSSNFMSPGTIVDESSYNLPQDATNTDASLYSIPKSTTTVDTNVYDPNSMYYDTATAYYTTPTNSGETNYKNYTTAEENYINSAATNSTQPAPQTPAEKIQALQTQNTNLQKEIQTRQADITTQNKSPKVLKENPALAAKLAVDQKAIQEYQAQITINNKQIASLQATASTTPPIAIKNTPQATATITLSPMTSATNQERSNVLGKLQSQKKKKKRNWYGKPKITL